MTICVGCIWIRVVPGHCEKLECLRSNAILRLCQNPLLPARRAFPLKTETCHSSIYIVMTLVEMMRWGAPAMLILLHLHLLFLEELDGRVAGASAVWCLSCCLVSMHGGPCQAYDWVEYFSGAGKVSKAMREARAQNIFTCIFLVYTHWSLIGAECEAGFVGVELDKLLYKEHRSMDFLTEAGFAC